MGGGFRIFFGGQMQRGGCFSSMGPWGDQHFLRVKEGGNNFVSKFSLRPWCNLFHRAGGGAEFFSQCQRGGEPEFFTVGKAGTRIFVTEAKGRGYQKKMPIDHHKETAPLLVKMVPPLLYSSKINGQPVSGIPAYWYLKSETDSLPIRHL